MRVACDTNFLVGAALHPKGLAAVILELVIATPRILILSPLVLGHVGRALRYPRIQNRYGVSAAVIEDYLDYLRGVSATITSPTPQSSRTMLRTASAFLTTSTWLRNSGDSRQRRR